MFLSKFNVVFDAMQLSVHAIDLINHHLYNVKLHPLFTDGTSNSLQSKLTELFGYLQVDTFFAKHAVLT